MLRVAKSFDIIIFYNDFLLFFQHIFYAITVFFC